MIGKMVKELLLRLFAMMHRDDSPKVVFYHDVGKLYTPMGTEAEIFWRHVACLRPMDVVCFDDGFRGIWDNREKLKAKRSDFSARVVVFLAVGLVEKSGYLTWNEIRTLQDEYGIEFQCHTWSHQTLVGGWNDEEPIPTEGRTEAWYRHELVDSKAELERRLGSPVTSLCLPVGRFSDDVIRRCRDAGYEKVYASYPGDVTEAYIQPRCLVQDLSVAAFKAALRGGMSLLKSHYRSLHYDTTGDREMGLTTARFSDETLG